MEYNENYKFWIKLSTNITIITMSIHTRVIAFDVSQNRAFHHFDHWQGLSVT